MKSISLLSAYVANSAVGPRFEPSKDLKNWSPKKINPDLFRWVLEGGLAAVFGCHDMALELVSGADFWCKLMSRASPGDQGGPGVDFLPNPPENLLHVDSGPTNLNLQAF